MDIRDRDRAPVLPGDLDREAADPGVLLHDRPVPGPAELVRDVLRDVLRVLDDDVQVARGAGGVSVGLHRQAPEDLGVGGLEEPVEKCVNLFRDILRLLRGDRFLIHRELVGEGLHQEDPGFAEVVLPRLPCRGGPPGCCCHAEKVETREGQLPPANAGGLQRGSHGDHDDAI